MLEASLQGSIPRLSLDAAPGCSGPCNPTIWDLIAYVGLGAVLFGLVAASYIVARRVKASKKTNGVLRLFTGVGALTAITVLVWAFPRPHFVPSAITVGLRGVEKTDPFYLLGNYSVTWVAEPVGTSTCDLTAELQVADSGVKVRDLVSVNLDAKRTGDSPALHALPGAQYQVAATSDCDWKITFEPD